MVNLRKNIEIGFTSKSGLEEKIEETICISNKLDEDSISFAHNAVELTKNIDEKIVIMEATGTIEEMRKSIKNITQNIESKTFSTKEASDAIQELMTSLQQVFRKNERTVSSAEEILSSTEELEINYRRCCG